MDKKDLLKLAAEMTLEEKALQMTQLSPDMLYHLAPANLTGPLREWRFEDEELWKVGSTLGPLGASYLKKLQKDYLERSGKKIPLLFTVKIYKVNLGIIHAGAILPHATF